MEELLRELVKRIENMVDERIQTQVNIMTDAFGELEKKVNQAQLGPIAPAEIVESVKLSMINDLEDMEKRIKCTEDDVQGIESDMMDESAIQSMINDSINEMEIDISVEASASATAR